MSIHELWLGYLALTGSASKLELQDYLSGALIPDPYQYNVIALTLNERFMELGLTDRVVFVELS